MNSYSITVSINCLDVTGWVASISFVIDYLFVMALYFNYINTKIKQYNKKKFYHLTNFMI